MAFSFNIGSFLGGAAQAGSQRIDEVRKVAGTLLLESYKEITKEQVPMST